MLISFLIQLLTSFYSVNALSVDLDNLYDSLLLRSSSSAELNAQSHPASLAYADTVHHFIDDQAQQSGDDSGDDEDDDASSIGDFINDVPSEPESFLKVQEVRKKRKKSLPPPSLDVPKRPKNTRTIVIDDEEDDVPPVPARELPEEVPFGDTEVDYSKEAWFFPEAEAVRLAMVPRPRADDYCCKGDVAKKQFWSCLITLGKGHHNAVEVFHKTCSVLRHFCPKGTPAIDSLKIRGFIVGWERGEQEGKEHTHACIVLDSPAWDQSGKYSFQSRIREVFKSLTGDETNCSFAWRIKNTEPSIGYVAKDGNWEAFGISDAVVKGFVDSLRRKGASAEEGGKKKGGAYNSIVDALKSGRSAKELSLDPEFQYRGTVARDFQRYNTWTEQCRDAKDVAPLARHLLAPQGYFSIDILGDATTSEETLASSRARVEAGLRKNIPALHWDVLTYIAKYARGYYKNDKKRTLFVSKAPNMGFTTLLRAIKDALTVYEAADDWSMYTDNIHLITCDEFKFSKFGGWNTWKQIVDDTGIQVSKKYQGKIKNKMHPIIVGCNETFESCLLEHINVTDDKKKMMQEEFESRCIVKDWANAGALYKINKKQGFSYGEGKKNVVLHALRFIYTCMEDPQPEEELEGLEFVNM